MKRSLPLLPLVVAVVLVFTFAPDAAACWKCTHTIDYSYCDSQYTWHANCDDSTGACYAWDPCWGAMSVAPLSTEFTVVSVERIDGANEPAETLVARVEVSEETKR